MWDSKHHENSKWCCLLSSYNLFFFNIVENNSREKKNERWLFFLILRCSSSQYHHCRLVLGSFQKMSLSLQTLRRNLTWKISCIDNAGRKTFSSFGKMLWVKCITEMVVKGPGGCKGQQCWSWAPCTAIASLDMCTSLFLRPWQGSASAWTSKGKCCRSYKVVWAICCPHWSFLGTAALGSLFLCQLLNPAQGRELLSMEMFLQTLWWSWTEEGNLQ